MLIPRFIILVIFALVTSIAFPQKKNAKQPAVVKQIDDTTFKGLAFRNIGPAITSGRVVDIAVNPKNNSEYYVAAAAGGVWKTINSGITFEPIFDAQPTFSIGCIAIDPQNSNVIWVGSGENNNQRSVSYGDGIYKSEDGGKSWKNVGLKESEHIGMIAIDPNNPAVVYVAAYGPLWSDGGDRGIYKTTDGGNTWKKILSVSKYTGFNEIHLDPRQGNVLYATAHQRQRKVFTYIGGGPESAIYKSTDSGATWSKIMKGLPAEVDLGRIGLAISPVDPDLIYAIVEAANDKSGFFASTDRGASWQKRSDFSTSGNYYQEIFCDPRDVDKVFAMDTYLKVSEDGGKTFKNLGEHSKHVDNHVIWVDSANTSHMLVGCDGGVYESFDGGKFWDFKSNLPLTQFYKVALDNSYPFYFVYGGTQDNFSLGGPSRTISGNGIVNSDWFFTSTGDGFESQVDYENPDIIYAQSQYGGLVRYDRKTGQMLKLKPVEASGEEPYRWNWDAPLLISKHDHKRLYFASNKVFRTDDQGNSWREISPDLSRGLDRNKLTVMGRVWSIDAVAKNQSTDHYGQVTTIAESPKDPNILYAGTDDGLIHLTSDGGKNWSKIDNISGVPVQTYVNQVIASSHSTDVAYAAFNQHRYGDFKPYLFKTADRGKTWQPMQNNLPERGSVYCIAEDHKNPDLLFCGTEFGAYFSINGGREWNRLKAGLPTEAIRDMEIQQRDNDLVLASFGRGFYVLDDYTILQSLKKADLDKEAFVATPRKTLMYAEVYPLGVRGKGFQGESFWNTPNPAPGAIITYYLKNDIKTLKEQRREFEKTQVSKNLPPYYPSFDSLRKEDEEKEPYLLFTVTDAKGEAVRQLQAPTKKGLSRITWDLRTDAPQAVNITPLDAENVFSSRPQGIFVLPGKYSAIMSKVENGRITRLDSSGSFEVEALNMHSMPAGDKKVMYEFGEKTAALYKAVNGSVRYSGELVEKFKYLRQAVLSTPAVNDSVLGQIVQLENQLNEIRKKLIGDPVMSGREFDLPPSIYSRVSSVMDNLVSSTSGITTTFQNSYLDAIKEFAPQYEALKMLDGRVKQLERLLENNHAPYTPGRFPDWKPK